jgi:prefoldin subunit 4
MKTKKSRKSCKSHASKTARLTVSLRYKIGDSFFLLPVTEVQHLLTASIEKIDSDVTAVEDKLGEFRDEMQQLKTALYGRFGRSINLEA